jgi:chitin synthase
LLLSPTYTNVINVYAFCNTHDVTWGTKGDDVKKEDINGNAKAGKKADEELGYDDAELDDLYDAALQKFSTEYKEPEKPDDDKAKKAKAEADTRSFRTNIVLVWMFCNAALVAIVLKTGGVNRLSLKQTTEGTSAQVKIYLSVVLWSVAGLSGFKFIGAMWYKIKRMVRL